MLLGGGCHTAAVRLPVGPLSEFLSSPSLFSANQLLVKRTELEARVDLSNNPSETNK